MGGLLSGTPAAPTVAPAPAPAEAARDLRAERYGAFLGSIERNDPEDMRLWLKSHPDFAAAHFNEPLWWASNRGSYDCLYELLAEYPEVDPFDAFPRVPGDRATPGTPNHWRASLCDRRTPWADITEVPDGPGVLAAARARPGLVARLPGGAEPSSYRREALAWWRSRRDGAAE